MAHGMDSTYAMMFKTRDDKIKKLEALLHEYESTNETDRVMLLHNAERNRDASVL